MTVIFSNQIMCFNLGLVQVNYYRTTILMIISYRSSYRFRFLAGNFALISWVFSCNNWKVSRTQFISVLLFSITVLGSYTGQSLSTIVTVTIKLGDETIVRLNSRIRNRDNFFVWAIFLFQKIGNDSVNLADSGDIQFLVQFPGNSILKILLNF